MTWILENWETIVKIVGGLITVATLVTGLFDGPSEDDTASKLKRALATVQSWLHRFSAVTHPSEQGTFKLPGKK